MPEHYIAKVGDIVSFCCGANPGECTSCGSEEYTIMEIGEPGCSQIITVEPFHRPGCEIPNGHCKTCKCSGMAKRRTLRESFGAWTHTYHTKTGVLKVCGVQPWN